MRKQRAFATLTEEEINQVADWLRHEKYEEVRQRVNKPRPEGFGLKISVGPLQTLYRKTNIVAKINSHFSGPSDEHLTVTKLDAILTGDQPASEKAHSAIMEATYEMATSGENTVTQLLGLQRLADFPARLEIREQRIELDHQKFEHKLEMDTFRKDMTQKRFDFAQETFAFRQQVHQDRLQIAEKRLQSSGSQPSTPQSDQQGPFARTREDISERVRIRIGISKEEAERRRALRNAHREEQARLAAQQPQPEFTGTGGARSTAPETSPLPPEPAHGGDESTRPCNADFQSAVLLNITPAPNLNPNPNSVNTSPIANCPSSIPSTTTICEENVRNRQTNSWRAKPRSGSPDLLFRLGEANSESSVVNSSPSLPSFPSVQSDSSSVLSVPLPLSCSDLQSAVDSYTIKRAREYAAYNRRICDPQPNGTPEYVTEFRHCPCGHATPCPIHENEQTYGRFPDSFWKCSAYTIEYAQCLQSRHLPYRAPKEFGL